jgi:tRNA pseudouridine13 synthase
LLDLPLLAPKTVLAEPWDGAAAAALQEEGITLEQLKIPGLRRPFFGEAPRRLFVTAGGFSLTPAEADPLSSTATRPRLCRTASFELPKGCYATVLLRALGQ